MAHPLQDVMAAADGFLVIGESSKGRFPAMSFAAYTAVGKRFYVVDLDGLSESRGPVKGGKVYGSIDELPAERGDLAVLWVHPHTASRAVELAHAAGCTRVWFSFQTGHPDAVARARELGMEVVEIGRCPVYYLDGTPAACRMHTAVTRLSGTWRRPPQLDPSVPRKELV
ncbi:MAG: CoA-binding protein [Alphaproteobacteria bacterium]|nr:CoA-binding protein [Alphaproteobacteria bacterium]